MIFGLSSHTRNIGTHGGRTYQKKSHDSHWILQLLVPVIYPARSQFSLLLCKPSLIVWNVAYLSLMDSWLILPYGSMWFYTNNAEALNIETLQQSPLAQAWSTLCSMGKWSIDVVVWYTRSSLATGSYQASVHSLMSTMSVCLEV